MRELEVQLSKKDILRMMSDMRFKKDGMKESKIQAVMLIIAGTSLIYTVGVMLLGGHDPSILYAEKTRHQILVYMKRIGTVKTLLTLPDSAFTGEAEMDCCLAFLQEKQQQEAFMDPLDQQAEIICPEEQVYSFAFIQEEAEWLDLPRRKTSLKTR